MKDIINRRVKHRETFRPFAPAVLEEKMAEYFDCDYPSPFMLFVYKVKSEKREKIPAVTHVDNTARVQTVNKDENPSGEKKFEQNNAVLGEKQEVEVNDVWCIAVISEVWKHIGNPYTWTNSGNLQIHYLIPSLIMFEYTFQNKIQIVLINLQYNHH